MFQNSTTAFRSLPMDRSIASSGTQPGAPSCTELEDVLCFIRTTNSARHGDPSTCHAFIIDPSFSTYYSSSSLLFPRWSVQCYIGPCGVLVPFGMVHSNNDIRMEDPNMNLITQYGLCLLVLVLLLRLALYYSNWILRICAICPLHGTPV